MNSAKNNADLGVSVPTPNTIVQHSSRLVFRKRRMASSLFLSISRARDVLTFLFFPHDYICAFLIVWKSNQFLFPSYFSNRTTSFVIKFKPFPELADILLREQCETSGGCWHKHKLEAAVHSPNLGFFFTAVSLESSQIFNDTLIDIFCFPITCLLDVILIL